MDTAPIPPGAADGHPRDYGRFLVASGPYMVTGAPAVLHSVSAASRAAALATALIWKDRSPAAPVWQVFGISFALGGCRHD